MKDDVVLVADVGISGRVSHHVEQFLGRVPTIRVCSRSFEIVHELPFNISQSIGGSTTCYRKM